MRGALPESRAGGAPEIADDGHVRGGILQCVRLEKRHVFGRSIPIAPIAEVLCHEACHGFVRSHKKAIGLDHPLAGHGGVGASLDTQRQQRGLDLRQGAPRIREIHLLQPIEARGSAQFEIGRQEGRQVRRIVRCPFRVDALLQTHQIVRTTCDPQQQIYVDRRAASLGSSIQEATERASTRGLTERRAP